LELIQKSLNSVKLISEPEIPFPQADSFERVINLFEILNSNEKISKIDLLENYDFRLKDSIDPRQVDYYVNAGRYLGLIDKASENGEIIYSLSNLGIELFQKSIINRQIMFIELILSHRVFNRTLALYFKEGELPSRSAIVEIMKDSNLYKINQDTTFLRRSSTIVSWINWILDQIEE
jgi:hypothetical protein